MDGFCGPREGFPIECPERLCGRALRVVGVDEWIVKAIQAMYDGATTAVRLRDGESKEFGVKVGVHQGSVLSPLLFTIVLEALESTFIYHCPGSTI